jgi:ribosomal protein L32
MQPLLCVLCVSAVNRRSLGGDAALACGTLAPSAGSPRTGGRQRFNPVGGCCFMHFLWVLCFSGVILWWLGGGAALACCPLSRPHAGSYVVRTCGLVGARLGATRWISPQRRRVRRGAMADAASSLRSLHLCGESKVARGRCGACVQSAESPPGGRHTRVSPVGCGGSPAGGCFPAARPGGGATQRTGRKRRISPERPSIHRRDPESAEKRLHPPWPLCALCVSAVKSNASPASGLLRADGNGGDVGIRSSFLPTGFS